MRSPVERTIYSYIDYGIFNRNIDLRRKVVYKAEETEKPLPALKTEVFEKTGAIKFLEYIAANKSVYVVEMDTVEGAKFDPCFLTMFFRNCLAYMLMFLLEEQTQKEVTRIFDA